jgi:hypothetical protein
MNSSVGSVVDGVGSGVGGVGSGVTVLAVVLHTS